MSIPAQEEPFDSRWTGEISRYLIRQAVLCVLGFEFARARVYWARYRIIQDALKIVEQRNAK